VVNTRPKGADLRADGADGVEWPRSSGKVLEAGVRIHIHTQTGRGLRWNGFGML